MSVFRSRSAVGALVASAALLTACSDDAVSPIVKETTFSPVTATDSSAVRQVAAERLGRLVALALREPSARSVFYHAASNSVVTDEKKLFLGGFLRGEGMPLLQAMARAGGMDVPGVLALLSESGPMEMYLPVDAHRAAWKGGTDVQVAVALKDGIVPAGFDLNGNRVQLSGTRAPAIPTVAITFLESFDPAGTPFAGLRARENQGWAAAHNVSALQVPSGPRAAMVSTPWTGVWVNSVYIPGDYESWYAGDPEYEMIMERLSDRKVIRCANMNSIEPFRFDMNSTTYPHMFLIAWDQETPSLEGLAFHWVEDDDTECVLKKDKDYLKLAVEFYNSASTALKAAGEKQWDQAVVAFKAAWVAIKSMVSGNDTWVGVVASDVPVDGTEKTMLIKAENGQDRGWVKLQWKSDYGY